MNNPIPNESLHEVTGPSAFFWLVCIALNSVAQPNGTVCGLRYPYKSVFRSSPVICAFDATNIFVTWVFTTCFTLIGARKSAAKVLSDRFPGTDFVEVIKNLRGHMGCRWITFALGVLPQCIKLFSSGGIRWLKLFGAMHMAPWVLFELLLIIADPEFKPDNYISPFPQFSQSSVRQIWGTCGIITHTVFLGSLVPLTYFSTLLVVMGCVTSLSLGIGFLQCILTENWYVDVLPSSASTLAVLTGATFHLPRNIESANFHLNEFMTTAILVLLGVAAGAIIAYSEEAVFLKAPPPQQLPAIKLLVCAVILPLVYFRFGYDSRGTHQPQGLEWLG